MNKIKITRINPEIYNLKGFDHVGCHDSCCDDACCVHGADFDKESYDLVIKFKKLIEKELGVKIETCLTHEWEDDDEFLGKDATESIVGKDGFCMFHLPKGKGCVLYKLVHERQLPRRLIPSICRLYPLTWGDGELKLADDFYPKCNCTHQNGSSKNILHSQWEEVKDIFEFSDDVKKELESKPL